MIIGGVLGSNIFNVLLILPIASLFGVVKIPNLDFALDVMLVSLLSACLGYSILHNKLNSYKGALFLVSYILYLGSLGVR